MKTDRIIQSDTFKGSKKFIKDFGETIPIIQIIEQYHQSIIEFYDRFYELIESIYKKDIDYYYELLQQTSAILRPIYFNPRDREQIENRFYCLRCD